MSRTHSYHRKFHYYYIPLKKIIEKYLFLEPLFFLPGHTGKFQNEVNRMNKISKLGIFALISVGVIAITFSDAFSREWGGGYGHRGPGSGYMMGPGYGHMIGSGYDGYDSYKSELGLTENQREKIHRINSRYREKFFQNRNNRDKLYTLREEQRKEIESVLTKEQKEQFFGSQGYGRGGWYRGCGW